MYGREGGGRCMEGRKEEDVWKGGRKRMYGREGGREVYGREGGRGCIVGREEEDVWKGGRRKMYVWRGGECYGSNRKGRRGGGEGGRACRQIDNSEGGEGVEWRRVRKEKGRIIKENENDGEWGGRKREKTSEGEDEVRGEEEDEARG
ncbi:hypothetical protein Pcinc_033807 [Petrolisthes cinctipes]|uniref:Uncharacterized protein n=1 Tax=Petrolisthes cinctipes TaxID=88211 RepID=A0AAE1ERK7_PETCI|nr:hypothetical protein Pcinc_033807 [Petrolisthes cinctipes]